MSSASLERALCRICNTREFTHPVTGEPNKLYSFELDKCMSHLAGKYDKVRRHLAEKYVRDNQGIIKEMRTGQSQRRAVIKQEVKGAVKSEVKNE